MTELLTVHVGESREGLAKIEAGSCQVCVTSPPYWQLRSYVKNDSPLKQMEIGREPTPDEYVASIVSVMAGVKTALKDDGLLWLNIGDSYAAQRGGTAMPAETLAGGEGGKGEEEAHRGCGDGKQAHRNASAIGLKHKDLVMIPSRVALAMQKDGWYLRSMIPWIKRNPMPESVTDRPATAVEYVFLFSKQDKYYYDHEAVRMPYSDSTLRESRDGYDGEAIKMYEDTGAQNPSDTKRRIIESVRKKGHYEIDTKNEQSGLRRYEGFNDRWDGTPIGFGRNRRNSDWFMKSWQGLLSDDEGDPMALVVNTHGFKGAHFATLPEKLVQPMILASTKSGDIVLDPFFGAGTTGLVALKLGRKCIGCELNKEFADIARNRCSMQEIQHML